MITIRKVTLGLLLSAAAAVLILTAVLLWNYRSYPPPQGPYASELDQRARILQDRVEVLTKRVGDMELLVLILLGTSGLYAIVFVTSAYFSAMTFARQADRSIENIKDQLGLAMGDLRELKEETWRSIHQEQVPVAVKSTPQAESFEAQVAEIAQRTAGWNPVTLDAHAKLELIHFENVAAYLDLAAGSQLAQPLTGLYRRFGAFYKPFDTTRSRFYMDRALALAPAGSEAASEIHYDLACWLAGAHDFDNAVQELALAFKQQSKALDDRLAHDIEEGGELYELASMPPFDKAVNDVLLNVVL
jgi:hypothetical protein